MINFQRLGMTIFLWCLVIISARILLFCIPFLLQKFLTEGFMIFNHQDRMILLLTTLSLSCFAIGLGWIFKRGGLNVNKV